MTIGKKIRNALVGVAAVCGVIVVTLTVCRHTPLDGLNTPAPSQELAASFPYERRAALATDACGGMRVNWSAVADWPTGDSQVAKSVRTWIVKWLQDRYRRELFNGDLADWDAMTRFYGEQFLSDNVPRDEATSPAGRCPDADPGEDVFLGSAPQWFCMNTAIIEYEDERIVSYRAGFYGFFNWNATSAAYVECATFRKPDGKILRWEAFADTNVVFELVRELAKVKFKESADIYKTGIPVPYMPLFTNEGFWCFWGDYAIVHGHAYELNGAFPSLFIPWRDPTCGGLLPGNRAAVESLLTAEARSSLGLDKPKANRCCCLRWQMRTFEARVCVAV